MEDDERVETQGEFEESLKDSGIIEWLTGDSAPGEEAPAEEQPVDTGGATDRPRDEKGRFAKAEEPAEEPAVDSAEEEIPADAGIEEGAEEDAVLELDDELMGVLERYDGDVRKALLSLREKESFTGQQANEIGELRRALAEQRDILMQLKQAPPPQPVYMGPYRNDLEENPQGLLLEAIERGDQQTAVTALRSWGEAEPFEAAAFLYSQMNQPQAPPAAPAPPVQQGSAPEEDLEAAMSAVVSRHPDAEKYIPVIGETSKEFPTLRNFMLSGTPAQKAQAFEELLVIAKGRSAQTATSDAMKRVVLKTQEEVRTEKAKAAVVSGKTRTAAKSRTDKDRFFEAFDEAAGRLGGTWDGYITRGPLK